MIDTRSIIREAEKLARVNATSPGSAHDVYHVFRVRDLAVRLALAEGARRDIVELAALLHDAYDHKFTGSFEAAMEGTRGWLISNGADDGMADLISGIVHGVSFRGVGTPDYELPLEGRCVRDADRLDAMGAIGVARAVAYGAERSHPLSRADCHPKELDESNYGSGGQTTVNHFFEKLLILHERLETRTAKTMAVRRHRFLLSFLDELEKDLEGIV